MAILTDEQGEDHGLIISDLTALRDLGMVDCTQDHSNPASQRWRVVKPWTWEQIDELLWEF